MVDIRYPAPYIPYFIEYLTQVEYTIEVFPVQNNPKYLDPSHKMDLDQWDYFGRKTKHIVAEFHKTDLLFGLFSLEKRGAVV